MAKWKSHWVNGPEIAGSNPASEAPIERGKSSKTTNNNINRFTFWLNHELSSVNCICFNYQLETENVL